MNKVILIGNLSKDFNLKYLNTGTAVGDVSLAVNMPYKNKEGKTENEVCYIDLNMFGRTAEVCNQYLKKGSKICVEGRLIYQSWQDTQGNKKSKHVVSVEKVEFLDSKNGNTENQYQSNNNAQVEAPQVEANINLDQMENNALDSMIQKNFSIYQENEKIVIHFQGTNDEYESIKPIWADVFSHIKTKYQGKEFEIKKDIIEPDEIPF